MKIMHVAGARPNFVKIASIIRACNRRPEIESILVHTGQHYSPKMSQAFFEELEIPAPDINLEVGSGSHAWQTAEIMKRFEAVLLENPVDAVLTVGDVNSTVACVLVAAKLGVKTIHVEAGLRSFDRGMPEEINRVVTDSISDILFVSEPSGLENLKKEGVENGRAHFVGNVMIDTLLANKGKADASSILRELSLEPRGYAVLTLHRPSNVDSVEVFGGILQALEVIQNDIPVVFPAHPRTVSNLEKTGLAERLGQLAGVRVIDPLGYLDFLKLMANARLMLTDSGGIQEETTILGVPCLTLRENTERPVTITAGTNRLTGVHPEAIIQGYREAMQYDGSAKEPPLWDGSASDRIAEKLLQLLGNAD